MSEFLDLLKYSFVQRALIAGSLISVCASILGVILVLKHYSLIGHGLSEVGFASLSISAALKISAIYITAPAVIIAAFIIMFVSERFKTAGDIAIAVASSAALALGVIISSLSGSASNMSSYLFGSVLALNESDLIFAVILAIIIISAFVIFYNRLFLIAYNEDYARSLGINITFYQALISILTAFIIVTGMQIMGTLLISGVIILPAISAKNLASGFKSLVIFSAIISFIGFITGLSLSFALNIPAGAAVISANTIILIFVKVFIKK